MKLGITYPNGNYLTVVGECDGLAMRDGECVLEVLITERQTVRGLPLLPGVLEVDPRAMVCNVETLRCVFNPSTRYQEMTEREQFWLERVPSWPSYDVIPEYAADEAGRQERIAPLNRKELGIEEALSGLTALSVIAQQPDISAKLIERGVWSGCGRERAAYQVTNIVPHWQYMNSVIWSLDLFTAATMGADEFYGEPMPRELLSSLPVYFHIDADIMIDERGRLELPVPALLKGIALTPSMRELEVAGEGSAAGYEHGGSAALVLVDPNDSVPYLRFLPPVYLGEQCSSTYGTALALWAWLNQPIAFKQELRLRRQFARLIAKENPAKHIPEVHRATQRVDARRIVRWIVPGKWERTDKGLRYKHPLNIEPCEVYEEQEAQRVITV